MLPNVVLARAQDQARGQGFVVQAGTVGPSHGMIPLIAAVRSGGTPALPILRAISSALGLPSNHSIRTVGGAAS